MRHLIQLKIRTLLAIFAWCRLLFLSHCIKLLFISVDHKCLMTTKVHSHKDSPIQSWTPAPLSLIFVWTCKDGVNTCHWFHLLWTSNIKWQHVRLILVLNIFDCVSILLVFNVLHFSAIRITVGKYRIFAVNFVYNSSFLYLLVLRADLNALIPSINTQH